jgi:hypothetical protein
MCGAFSFTCLLDQEAVLQRAISTHGRRAPSAFRQQDVTRAVKAAKGAGVPVAAIKISPQGELQVVVGERRRQDSVMGCCPAAE